MLPSSDEARRAKYISKILKLLENFLLLLLLLLHFTFHISYTCVECGKDVMSDFASSSPSLGIYNTLKMSFSGYKTK